MTGKMAEQAAQDEPTDAEQARAEKMIVDLVRALINAAKDGRSHGSHEGAATCMGCRALRDGVRFVRSMTDPDWTLEKESA